MSYGNNALIVELDNALTLAGNALIDLKPLVDKDNNRWAQVRTVLRAIDNAKGIERKDKQSFVNRSREAI